MTAIPASNANGPGAPRLSLGPLLFNWGPERTRDFYFRIADEADLDVVYLGEVVCSKRWPFLAGHVPDMVERLSRAGKEVVLSTLALVMSARDFDLVRAVAEADGSLIEANDLSAVSLLAGRPHVIGPLVPVYNEGTLAWLAENGAVRVALAPELDGDALKALAGAGTGVELEVQAFGRLPLAISARCYHARNRGLHRDGCQYVCGEDADGLAVATLDGAGFLAVNGMQTLSHACVNLACEVPALAAIGIGCLRLSPQAVDMVAVARVFRDLALGSEDGAGALRRLDGLAGGMPFANGFFHGMDGAAWVAERG